MIFSKTYNRSEFLRFLRVDFLPDGFVEEVTNIAPSTKTTYTSRVTKLGASETLDLIVLEIQHTGKDDPRVGLSKEAFRILSSEWESRALVLFVPENNPANYRFSLIEIKLEGDSNTDKVHRRYSNPRRYSYLLGEGVGGYTPNKYLKAQIKDEKDLFERFNVETLTEEFYKRLFDWYEWALSDKVGVTFPTDSSTGAGVHRTEEHLIRLITRLMFVWFIKQKNLIPSTLFDIDKLTNILSDFNPTSTKDGNYYNAILQNLFFATLNQSIEHRGFANDANQPLNREHYGVKTLYRYGKMFQISQAEIINLFATIPFLNGGLFECLDKDAPDSDRKIVYSDGFSRNPKQRAFVPNILFFDEERGLIELLARYNFTIEENTPFDQEVSLDPELLGKVFENLLASFNPETKETARNQTGSFYTPREVVQYMVDESLVAYLKRTVGNELETEYRKLMLYTDEEPTLSDDNKMNIVQSLFHCKILDPACGSGAYPMGALQQMVHLLSRLDKDNKVWERIVMDDAINGSRLAFEQRDEEERKELLNSVEEVFKNKLNNLDYARKLYLIENSIYGVDIQSIAVQISKLRFFISLIIEQQPTNDPKENFGIRPLPNLETKFVAANTLLGLSPKEASASGTLFSDPTGVISDTKNELKEVRQKHFSARTAKDKSRYRTKDKKLREKLAKLLEENEFYNHKDAGLMAGWDPYNQSDSSLFFDPEWMFGVSDGFDIIIGNPPYIQLQNNGGMLAKQLEQCRYKTFARTGDIYCIFYERGWQLLKKGGIVNLITSNKWMRAGYGEKSRGFFAANTNPLLLIDFAGVKVFKSATVDTNILMFARAANLNATQACVVKQKSIENLSDYIQQNLSICAFNTSNSWVVLSPIEQRIKEKIERIGTPLKDWDVQINYGIKTGFNEAFIISGAKKDELIAKDPKSAEIIRPILRGRDIKRYSYEFADLYLIATFPSRKYDIELYPAVKEHLLSFGFDRLDQSGKPGARKKTNNKWFETQDSISYWDDFNKQKIVWKAVGRNLTFSLLESGKFLTAPASFINSDHNLYLLGFLSSKYGKYFIYNNSDTTGAGDIMLNIQSLVEIPIPNINDKRKKEIEDIVLRILHKIDFGFQFEEEDTIIDCLIFSMFEFVEEEVEYIIKRVLG